MGKWPHSKHHMRLFITHFNFLIMRIGLGRPHKDFCKLKQTQLPKLLSIDSRMPSKLLLKSSFWLTKVESYKDYVRKVGSLNGTRIVILKTILFFHSLGQKGPEQDNPLVSGHFPRAFRMHIIWGYSISMGPLLMQQGVRRLVYDTCDLASTECGHHPDLFTASVLKIVLLPLISICDLLCRISSSFLKLKS